MFVLLGLTIYVALPITLTWGWVRWVKRREFRTASPILSFIGFLLASASALLAIATMVYAARIGGFPYYDSRLLRIYRWGLLLSCAGIIFSIGGAWRPSVLRWYAPAAAIGMFLFWFAMATTE